MAKEKAALWTDGRYFLQAEEQLDPNNWTLMKQGQKDVPSITEWLGNITKHYRIGIDPKLLTIGQI